MKILLTLQAAVLVFFSMGSIAAEVEYRHPNLTIVAKNEPLGAVLKALSKEMRIFVTTPTDINPLVNCDIKDQPIKLAFKKLLGTMSYSLEWKDNGETLIGLTILTGTGDAAPSISSGSKANAPIVDQAAAVTITNRADQRSNAAQAPELDASMGTEQEEREARTEAEREEREVRMAQEQTVREAEMVIRREAEVKAHEARMAEEVVRNEADMAEYFESQGRQPLP
jgi:hypothetical protein